jgi:hypothetical protein
MQPPDIDGNLDDEAWSAVEAASGFTQRDPDEGKPSTERTEVKFLYDDEALYVGVRLFDRQAALISRRLSTRDDDADADRVTIFLDTMHDHLTGAIFRVSAANVQQDFTLFNDSSWDSSWDGVWQSAVSVDDGGWTAEIRIPLSQLRFVRQDRATWGINVERFIRRNNESAWLEMVPKTESGLASRMPHLAGLDGLRPRRRLEFLPYVAARDEFVAPATVGHPFNDGSRAFVSVGLDLKWGLGSNLTLDGTVNPDFGQVEVDPAVVNLSAFETFFPEKRPFFLEGSQIFNNFGQGGANNFWGFNMEDPQIFYSRRIGRSPQVSPTAEFFDVPDATTILGAAKLTGKTNRGWSIGFIDAITEHETARTQSGTLDGRESVEPLTNYFIARVQRDIGARAGLGFITTGVTRRLESEPFEAALADQAYVAGADGHFFFDADRQWVITGKVSSSRVSGSTAYLERLQRAPQHYFQRPDAPQVSFDPTRTSLEGLSGKLALNRNSGVWTVNAALWGVSPGFEANDLGFQNAADRAGAHGVFMWRDVTPDVFTRSRQFWAAKSWTWNYNREIQSDGYFASANLEFMNYWEVGASGRFLRRTLDDRLTRGGPSAESPRHVGWDVDMSTDRRKWFSFGLSAGAGSSAEAGWDKSIGLSINLKPSPLITISTGPEFRKSQGFAQYIQTVPDPTATATYNERYVFGTIDNTQLSMTTRVGVVLTPRVSIQLFLQPLLAVGDYTDFKELARPRTFDFNHYDVTPLDALTNRYTVDPDGDGPASPFSFRDPDFNLKSARINAVFRYELKPGSTFYAVWTRQQEDVRYPGNFALGRDAGAMAGAPGDDVFLVKLAYWIGR